MPQAQGNPSSFGGISKLTWVWFGMTLLAIGIVTEFGPAEHSLGTHIRVVYLHGAWVWAALAAFMAAGVCGGVGLVLRRPVLHSWSASFGRTGLIFWITYLPLSLLAMQSNWNGLFQAEPRWRLALVFSIAGLLLQTGLALADKPALTSALNLVYMIALLVTLIQTPNVMHPASPIMNSNAWRIQHYFISLVLLTILAAGQMSWWWFKREPKRIQR